MTEPNQLSLDDIAYTADVNLFLKTLARIVARVLGRSESEGDNEDHEAEWCGQADDEEPTPESASSYPTSASPGTSQTDIAATSQRLRSCCQPGTNPVLSPRGTA